MSSFEKGDKSNYIILAKPKWHTEKGCWYDCEGDKVFIPYSVSYYDEKNCTIEIPEWFFNKYFKK